MYQTIITEIEQNMLPHLNNEQLEINISKQYHL